MLSDLLCRSRALGAVSDKSGVLIVYSELQVIALRVDLKLAVVARF